MNDQHKAQIQTLKDKLNDRYKWIVSRLKYVAYRLKLYVAAYILWKYFLKPVGCQILKLSQRYQAYLCVIAATILIIFGLYVTQPYWMLVLIAVLLIGVASWGIAITDHRIGVYENRLQDTLLHNMRVQLSAGIPEINNTIEAQAQEIEIDISKHNDPGTIISSLLNTTFPDASVTYVKASQNSSFSVFQYHVEHLPPDLNIGQLKEALKNFFNLVNTPFIEVSNNYLTVKIAKHPKNSV